MIGKIDCYMRLNKRIKRKYKCPRAFFSVLSASSSEPFHNIESNFWIVFISCLHWCFYRWFGRLQNIVSSHFCRPRKMMSFILNLSWDIHARNIHDIRCYSGNLFTFAPFLPCLFVCCASEWFRLLVDSIVGQVQCYFMCCDCASDSHSVCSVVRPKYLFERIVTEHKQTLVYNRTMYKFTLNACLHFFAYIK